MRAPGKRGSGRTKGTREGTGIVTFPRKRKNERRQPRHAKLPLPVFNTLYNK